MYSKGLLNFHERNFHHTLNSAPKFLEKLRSNLDRDIEEVFFAFDYRRQWEEIPPECILPLRKGNALPISSAALTLTDLAL